MRSSPTKRSRAPSAAPTLFGAQASNAFLPRSTSPTSRGAAQPAAPSASAPSAEITRARDILRDILLREDSIEEVLLLSEVRNQLDYIGRMLDSLAGKQLLFELWIG